MIRTGITLFLEPHTRVPNWIRHQTLNIKIGHERLKGRTVRSLRIEKGEALFFPGGSVWVKMPGSGEFWEAFQPLKVLEIRNLGSTLIKRNHYLCVECATLTGKMVGHKPSDVSGRVDANFQCTQCGYQWEVKRM